MRAIGIVLTAIAVAAANSGCSAGHWGGDVSGKRPGVDVEGPSLFRPGGRIQVTSDAQAELERLTYEKGKLEIVNAKFGQDASSVVREEPAKIDAIARLQLTQVEYARVTWNGVKELAHEIMPVLKLLAMANFIPTDTGMTMTLPNGFSFGKHTITSPQQLQDVLRETMGTLDAATAAAPATQPAP